MQRLGAMEGITVLDLTRVLAGPFSGMMLADMGANVIKIEEAGKGADERQLGPFQNGESAYYMNLNRNKKGVSLNLKSPKGKEVFKKLVKNADVVLENYRPGTMDKLGLGYDVLKEVNPGIIYAAVSGFGQYGPYSKRPGYERTDEHYRLARWSAYPLRNSHGGCAGRFICNHRYSGSTV
jgi:crotonobetainyl-CoA:carnitine CoA-transferase CaiB-like acyl-CoA transferase